MIGKRQVEGRRELVVALGVELQRLGMHCHTRCASPTHDKRLTKIVHAPMPPQPQLQVLPQVPGPWSRKRLLRHGLLATRTRR